MTLTNFPNGISSFGMPVNGSVPTTFGNTANKGGGTVYYVNPTTGSDGNKGTDMSRPFATMGKANTSATTNNHDVIVLSATSAHAQTDELAVTKNRLHYFGLDAVGRYYGLRTRVTMGVTTGTAIAIVQNTGVGNSFENIKFDSSDTLSTSLYAFADGGEYTRIHGCELYKSSLLTTDLAAELLMNGDSSYVSGCTIGSNVNSTGASGVERPCVILDRETITGKVARDVMFENCLFWKKSAHADSTLVYGAGATDVERMFLIRNSMFHNDILSAADPTEAVGFGATLTQGYAVIWDCVSIGCDAQSATTGVYVQNAVPTAGTSGIAVQAS